MNLFNEPDEAPPPMKRRGHAAMPGGGPAGETCGSCQHYTPVQYHDYVHRKCGLMEHHWSHCSATDIRKRDPACRFWESAK